MTGSRKLVTALAGIVAIIIVAANAYSHGADIGTEAVWAIVATTGALAAGNVGEHFAKGKAPP